MCDAYGATTSEPPFHLHKRPDVRSHLLELTRVPAVTHGKHLRRRGVKADPYPGTALDKRLSHGLVEQAGVGYEPDVHAQIAGELHALAHLWVCQRVTSPSENEPAHASTVGQVVDNP